VSYRTLEQMVVAVAEDVRPPERLSVSEAAGRYHIVKNPGQHEGAFSLAKTPYLREPMDVLTSREFTGMAFAGPARTGKSAMGINWLAHTAITNPMDMLFVQMAQHTARDWSQADLAKALRNSPELRRRLVPGRQNDNVYDKRFLSGMRAVITWPTMKNLSGKTIPYQFIFDLDRIKPQIIDKEAHVFDATRTRGKTFRHYAMCGAEGSPGFPITDANWQPATPHEAPPTEGILSLYNRGDRRRWYWPCPHCGGTFEPRFNLLQYPSAEECPDMLERAEQTYMACPHCFTADGALIEPNMQRTLNLAGRWIKEGQTWNRDGSITGVARRSDIASFWMFGPAASFSDWQGLVYRYLTALDVYEKTFDEGPLMTTVNVDQGEAYLSKQLESSRLPETLKARALDWGGSRETPCVPMMAGGGFLTATIDVQAGARKSFVVHVYLTSSGGDVWHIDMFRILKSARIDDEEERYLIDPAGYPEDWDLLIEQVIERTYPMGDGSGRRLPIKLTACDSGGEAGVTANAYAFYRRLRVAGKHKRFHLLKGSPSKTDTAPLRLTYPDAQQKDSMSAARGDVPVWLVNSNIVKDQVANMLDRRDPGGQVHFPEWAEGWLYKQLTTEIRTAKGAWENPSKRRNEAFDLLAYCVAFGRHPDIKLHTLDWSKPPGWAADWAVNDMLIMPGGISAPEAKIKRSLADLAKDLA